MNPTCDIIRKHNLDKRVIVQVVTAGTDDTATVALGSDYASFVPDVVSAKTSAGVDYGTYPTAVIDISGNLVITESASPGFSNGDLITVDVTQMAKPVMDATMSTA